MLVLISGTSRGIGKEMLKIFLKDPKCTVLAISRKKQTPNKAGRSSDPIYVQADINTSKGRKAILSAVKKTGKKVDVLINNAGAIVKKPFNKISEKELKDVYQTNVFSPFLLTQELLPVLHSNAHVVNIGSMGGFQGSSKFPGLSAYSSSKSALAGLSECMAEELAPKKIKVNCLAIGAVQTEMLSAAFPGYKAPLNANQMAEFIVWFALNAHQYMNGKVIPVSLSTP
ncbi:MAG TPA: SDR family oxidoreductase [Bacteroidia bacterium]|nr:SDR family oxidoreductase [Bacteroidia bacterium]